MIRDFLIVRSLTAATRKQAIAGAPRPPGLDQAIEGSGRGATTI
jgi:hypothetical protein